MGLFFRTNNETKTIGRIMDHLPNDENKIIEQADNELTPREMEVKELVMEGKSKKKL